MIYPGTEPTWEQANPEKSSDMIACATAKLLQAPKFGSATSFVVLTRAAHKDEQTLHPQNGRLRALLQQYEESNGNRRFYIGRSHARTHSYYSWIHALQQTTVSPLSQGEFEGGNRTAGR